MSTDTHGNPHEASIVLHEIVLLIPGGTDEATVVELILADDTAAGVELFIFGRRLGQGCNSKDDRVRAGERRWVQRDE